MLNDYELGFVNGELGISVTLFFNTDSPKEKITNNALKRRENCWTVSFWREMMRWQIYHVKVFLLYYYYFLFLFLMLWSGYVIENIEFWSKKKDKFDGILNLLRSREEWGKIFVQKKKFSVNTRANSLSQSSNIVCLIAHTSNNNFFLNRFKNCRCALTVVEKYRV